MYLMLPRFKCTFKIHYNISSGQSLNLKRDSGIIIIFLKKKKK